MRFTYFFILFFLNLFLLFSQFSWGQNENKCQQDEEEYQRIEKDVISHFKNSFLEKDHEGILKLLGQNFTFDSFETAHNQKAEVKNQVTKYLWNLDNLQEINDRDVLRTNLQGYFTQFSKIEYVSMKTDLIISSIKERDPIRKQMLAAKVRSLLVIQGENTEDNITQDKINLEITVNKKNGKWAISSIKNLQGESLISQKMSFIDNGEMIFPQSASPNINELQSLKDPRYLPKFSWADYNQDGFLDLYVTILKHGPLFKGNGKGKFVFDSQLPSLVSDLSCASFVQMNSKDKVKKTAEDLILIKESSNPKYLGEIHKFKNSGDGHFYKMHEIVPITLTKNQTKENFSLSGPCLFDDFNEDGFTDISLFIKGESYPRFFYSNENESDLKDETSSALSNVFIQNSINTTPSNLKISEARSLDYDHDQKKDLIFVSSNNTEDQLYKNIGLGKYIKMPSLIGLNHQDMGTHSNWGAILTNKNSDLVISNFNLLKIKRMNESCQKNWNSQFLKNGEFSLQTYTYNGAGLFVESKIEDIENSLIEEITQIESFDYDNDGLSDLLILSSLDETSDLFTKNKSQELNNFVLDIKKDRNLNKFLQLPWENTKKIYLFRNDGQGKFTDVSYIEGLSKIKNPLAFATKDFDQDGKIDILVLTLTSSQELAFRILKNDIKIKLPSNSRKIHSVAIGK